MNRAASIKVSKYRSRLEHDWKPIVYQNKFLEAKSKIEGYPNMHNLIHSNIKYIQLEEKHRIDKMLRILKNERNRQT